MKKCFTCGNESKDDFIHCPVCKVSYEESQAAYRDTFAGACDEVLTEFKAFSGEVKSFLDLIEAMIKAGFKLRS